MKKHLKSGIMLIIDSGASPTTIALKLGRSGIVRILDRLLPDDDEIPTEERITVSEAYRREK